MSVFDTLLSPPVLFFILGAFAALVRSDLVVPEQIAKGMSIYLMAAIGLKGGVQVSAVGASAEMFSAAALGIILSFTLPLIAFALLTKVGKVDRLNAGAVAAHYGSVSIVTYVTASQVLTNEGLAPAGFMVGVLALMETPAILTGLILAKGGLKQDKSAPGSNLWHEVMFNGSVLLLIGGFIIGLIIGESGYKGISPVFTAGFSGILCIFLLDMGLIAVRRLRESKSMRPILAGIAIVVPLINGTIALFAANALGLDVGTVTAFAMLAASASYIAVPAAMRMALPQADPGLYLSMSLAVSFPFNILVSIPLFTWAALQLAA
jgi:uncharacterized protein